MLKEKHYRMTEESIQIIQGRDRERYPSESSFVNAAVASFPRQTEKEKMQEELDRIYKKLEELCELLYLKNYGGTAGEKEIF